MSVFRANSLEAVQIPGSFGLPFDFSSQNLRIRVLYFIQRAKLKVE